MTQEKKSSERRGVNWLLITVSFVTSLGIRQCYNRVPTESGGSVGHAPGILGVQVF